MLFSDLWYTVNIKAYESIISLKITLKKPKQQTYVLALKLGESSYF